MIPPVHLKTSGGVLSAVDMVVQRRDSPCCLREVTMIGLLMKDEPLSLRTPATAQFIPPARRDKMVLFVSCLVYIGRLL